MHLNLAISKPIRSLRANIATTWWIAPACVLLGFVLVEVHYLQTSFVVDNLDYFPLVDRAVGLSFSSWDSWVGAIHPNGLPWLIRLGLELGFDAARVGQALSVLGGALALIGTYLIALAIWDNHRFALLCQTFVASTGTVLFFASVEGNDMPAAGWQILSVGILAYTLARTPPDRPLPIYKLIGAATAAGIGYLMRYTGMFSIAASILILTTLALRQRHPLMWKRVVAYSATVILVTALQWLPSLIVSGSPLAADQGQNLWFHVYGKHDFLSQWNESPYGITVLDVIRMDAGKVWRHWRNNFESFWLAPDGLILDIPLKLFSSAGIVFLLLAGTTVRVAVRALLGVYVLLHLAALSLLRLDPRFLIVLIPVSAAGAVYFFARILPARWMIRQVTLPIKTFAAVIAVLLALQVALEFAANRPQVTPSWIAASDVLHAAGMHQAQEVLSTNLSLQDIDALDRRRFAQANALAPALADVTSLVETARAMHNRFFIYDRESGPVIYPALQTLLTPESRAANLTPIYIEPDRAFIIYRIEPETSAPTTPLALFEQGLSLQTFEVDSHESDSEGGYTDFGVYLTWQARETPASSLKVFVHILDATGQLVAQDDGIPALWTYPTDRWAAGETVIDFHHIRIPSAARDASYTLQAGIYSEATNERLYRLDSAGARLEDKIILSTSLQSRPQEDP